MTNHSDLYRPVPYDSSKLRRCRECSKLLGYEKFHRDQLNGDYCTTCMDCKKKWGTKTFMDDDDMEFDEKAFKKFLKTGE